MVQVIQEGSPKLVNCPRCQATLSYHVKEIQKRVSTDYLGDSDTYYYITCPSCSAEVIVK